MKRQPVATSGEVHGFALWLPVLGVAFLCAFRCSIPIVDVDIWHEMALAREILSRGQVPQTDLFAYTPTITPVVHHEWGAGIVAYCTATACGATGVSLLRYLLLFATASICWLTAVRNGASPAMVCTLSVVAIMLAAAGYSPLRAQAYSFLFAALLLWCLTRDREGDRRWIWWWPVVYVLWLNMHAGFLVGCGFLFAYWLERAVTGQAHRHLLVLMMVLACLTMLNPYGVEYYKYLWRATTMARPRVAEWAPLWEHRQPVEVYTFIVSLGLLAYALWNRGWRGVHGLFIVVVSALASLQHARMTPFYAIAWLCFVPGSLEATELGRFARQLPRRHWRPWQMGWGSVLALSFIGLTINRGYEIVVPGIPNPTLCYPVGAVDFLRQVEFRGNLMVPYADGAYVSWKLFPHVLVSMDSRYEVAYPPQAVETNTAFYEGRDGWDMLLAQHPTDAILVPKGSPLVHQLQSASHSQGQGVRWLLQYHDDVFALFLRSDSAPELPVVDRSGDVILGTIP